MMRAQLILQRKKLNSYEKEIDLKAARGYISIKKGEGGENCM